MPLIQQNTSPINITYWLTNKTKVLPKSRNIFTEREINSGVTSMSLLHRELGIFRKEEYKKLTLHEMVHYLDLESCLRDGYLSQKVSKLFNINPERELRIYESYTELVAVLLNCIIVSQEYKEPNTNSYDLFLRFLEYETEYSLFQVAKILIFFKFKDVSDFTQEYDGLDRFKYTTDVFSYFFVKTALLCNLENVLEYIYTYCDGFKLSHNIEYKDKLADLILKSASSTNYLRRVQNYMDFINSENPNISKRILKSLRMTCIEA